MHAVHGATELHALITTLGSLTTVTIDALFRDIAEQFQLQWVAGLQEWQTPPVIRLIRNRRSR